jgi:secreted PhoX family phosphatase
MHEREDADDVGVNVTSQTPLEALIDARLSRRDALKGMAAGLFGLSGCASLDPAGVVPAPLTFREVPRSLDETHHVADGYTAQVLVRWGDPLRAGGPAFRPARRRPTSRKRSSAWTTTSSRSCRCPAARARRHAAFSA